MRALVQLRRFDLALRERMMFRSEELAMSASPMRATFFGSKLRKAFAEGLALRKMVSQERGGLESASHEGLQSARAVASATPTPRRGS